MFILLTSVLLIFLTETSWVNISSLLIISFILMTFVCAK